MPKVRRSSGGARLRRGQQGCDTTSPLLFDFEYLLIPSDQLQGLGSPVEIGMTFDRIEQEAGVSESGGIAVGDCQQVVDGFLQRNPGLDECVSTVKQLVGKCHPSAIDRSAVFSIERLESRLG